MSSSQRPSSQKRRSLRLHMSHSGSRTRVSNPSSGIPIQCERCPTQAFCRSTLRAEDLRHLLVMRYPVRCLRCGQRQMVSFTVAGISVPSHIKQRRVRNTLELDSQWTGPVKESLRPKPRKSAASEAVGSSETGSGSA